MNYILNSLEEIHKVYTPNIEYLNTPVDWIPFTFCGIEKTIFESMQFYQYCYYGDDYERENLSLKNFSFKNKSHKYSGLNYDYLLRKIDLEAFKNQLDKLISNQERDFINDIANTLENSESDIRFKQYFKNNIEKLIESESNLKPLISNSNDFIKLIISRYLESYSKTYNQLKKEYFDLLPKYFELKKTDVFDNNIQINNQKIKDNDLLQKYINDYSIFSLYRLETILEGQVVTITFEKPIYDEELDCTYTIDEVKLILSQFNIQDEKDRNYDENDYRHYANELSDDMKTWKLQKLNYEDFITYNNDFKDVVRQKLIDVENEILKLIPEFISINIDKIENIKYLINFTIIKKWKKYNLDLLNRFHNDEFVIVSYKSIKKIPLITDVMNIVYDRKENFIDKIKKEFSFYYVDEYHETEFSKSLNKLDFGLNKNSDSKKSNWEYVFEHILNGDIKVFPKKYNQFDFYYKEEEFKNKTKLGDYISTIIVKKGNFRPYFTDSIGTGGTKDIFKKSNLIKIEEILSVNENKMCTYFQEKYNKLIQK